MRSRFRLFFCCVVLCLVSAVAALGQDTRGTVADDPMSDVKSKLMTIWDLTVAGGIFMIPLFLCSVVVVAFSLERLVGLRTSKILPPELLAEIQQLNSAEKGLDFRKVYKLCGIDKSPLSKILRAAIQKIGRPQAEMEKALEDAAAREANLMGANIRPIAVCATVSPLLGLLGTVQGMIMAFIVTSTTTSTGTAKAQELAKGIYTALVTTFAGLCVAVVAVLFAHYLEAHIDRLLRAMEELFLDMVPQFYRFESRLRVAPPMAPADSARPIDPAVSPTHPPAKTAAAKNA